MTEKAIKLIAGLGNPGDKYSKTRHNAGFWFLDTLAESHNVRFKSDKKLFGETATISYKNQDIRLLKPTTFMNASGQSVSAAAKYFKIAVPNILVAHDELDIPAGSVRLKFAGGHGGHNGLRDMKALGSNEYWRLRIGIGHPGDKSQVHDHVLKNPGKAEREAIDKALSYVDDVLDNILQGDMEKAMHHLHTNT